MNSKWQQVEDRFKSLDISDSLEKINELRHLKEIACSPAQKVKFIYSLLEEMLSEYPEACAGPIPIDMWEDSVENALQMLEILQVNENIVFSFDYLPELYKNYYKGAEFKGQVRVPGDLASLAESFSFVFFSGLNQSEPLSAEYDSRLKEEPTIFLIFEKMIKYLEGKANFKRASEVAKLVVNFQYHKSQEDYDMMRKDFELSKYLESLGTTAEYEELGGEEHIIMHQQPIFPLSCREFMENMVHLVYMYGDEKMKEFTMLRDIYHLALIDRFLDSLKLMMKFLNESKFDFLRQIRYHEGIARKDFLNQIHFNRAMAQLALSAFRIGLLAEAQSVLAWLFVRGGGRVNELLGQDCPYTPSYGRKTLPVEKSGCVPYHIQINLDMLEAVYLICSMLVEVQVKTYNGTCKFISHDLHALFLSTENDDSGGSCKRIRANIINATKALEEGDFRKAFSLIESLNIWRFFRKRDDILEFLKTKMKEVALRTIIFSSSASYLRKEGKDSQSLDRLSTMFELSKDQITLVVRRTDFDHPSPNSFFDKLTEELSIIAESSDNGFEGIQAYQKGRKRSLAMLIE